MRGALTDWTEEMRRAGSRESATWTRAALAALVNAVGERLTKRLHARHFAEAIAANAARTDKRGRPLSMAAQRSYYKAMRRFSAHLHRRGLTASDLAADAVRAMELRGEALPWRTPAGARAMGRGKVQLANVAEARAYLKACTQDEDPERRVAAALPLLCGLSSGEVRNLRARDVDFAGRVLWVRDEPKGAEPVADPVREPYHVKTAARRRSVALPARLVPDMRKLVVRVHAGDLLFQAIEERKGPRERWQRSGKAHGRGWLHDLVRAVCARAEVTVVCPHGLRDTYSTLRAVLLGETAADIGDALGHADRGRTASRHYIGERRTEPALPARRRKA